MNNLSVLQLAYVALFGGLLATGAMTLFMAMVDKSGLANADMMRAVGSLLTKSLDNALLPGILIHFASGIVFAGIYAWAIAGLDPPTFAVAVVFSTVMAVFHGGIVGLMLVVAVAESHPLEKFRKAGFSVAAVHWVAHVIFGLVVGVVLGSALF